MAPTFNTWSDNVHPEDRPRVMAVLEEHLQGKCVRYDAEYRIRNRNGHYLWVHDRGRVCERGPDGRPCRAVGMLQDTSDRKQLELQLQELASLDALTGLANRREGTLFLNAQIELCQRLQLPLGLAMIDVDHFKVVNDEHGHRAGDRVLRSVGQVMRDAVRGSDLVCRWGGEEFVLIAPNTLWGEMAQLGEKVRAAVERALSQHRPAVSVSVGVTSASGACLDLGHLVDRADSALYRAKINGRNRVEVAEPWVSE